MGLGNSIGQIQSGKVRTLAVSGTKRSRLLPNVPTRAATGLGGYPGRVWWGLVVAAGTPGPIVAKLNAEFVQLFREPGFVEFLEARRVEPAVGTPEEFAPFLQADREAAATLIKMAKTPCH